MATSDRVAGSHAAPQPSFDAAIKSYYDRAREEERREMLLRLARALESEPSVVGSSAHLMVVGRKPAAR